ncbi:MAG: hypothetical protein EBX97_07435 [Actinobacteria bacterium]|nr:hypothetical protein [Actinomycetota bacterium]
MSNYLDKYDYQRQVRINAHYRWLARCLRNFVLAVIITCVILGLHQYNTNKAEAYTCYGDKVTVIAWDTLWRIAEEYCSGNISNATDDLVDKYGTTIQIGQVIDLPRQD